MMQEEGVQRSHVICTPENRLDTLVVALFVLSSACNTKHLRIKQLGLFLLPPELDANLSQSYPPTLKMQWYFFAHLGGRTQHWLDEPKAL